VSRPFAVIVTSNVLCVQVCRVAQAALRSDRKEQKLQETAERRRAGDKLAVPDPIYLIGRRLVGALLVCNVKFLIGLQHRNTCGTISCTHLRVVFLPSAGRVEQSWLGHKPAVDKS